MTYVLIAIASLAVLQVLAGVVLYRRTKELFGLHDLHVKASTKDLADVKLELGMRLYDERSERIDHEKLVDESRESLRKLHGALALDFEALRSEWGAASADTQSKLCSYYAELERLETVFAKHIREVDEGRLAEAPSKFTDEEHARFHSLLHEQLGVQLEHEKRHGGHLLNKKIRTLALKIRVEHELSKNGQKMHKLHHEALSRFALEHA